MKRALAVFVAFLTPLLLVSSGFVSQPVHAATDNFVITNYVVEMNLGRDSEGRSTLRTTETITADFPQTDENHGLERIIVKQYDNHDTSFQIVSIMDENNNNLPYHWSGDALRIGSGDTYVHGSHTYKIVFTQRDVTKFYADTNKDEFYWDVIGTEWRVPIEQASLKLSIAPDILNAISGTPLQCYVGLEGENKSCVTQESDGVYSLSVQNIGGYSGVTVALGFNPGTFSPYKVGLWEIIQQVWATLTAYTSVIGFMVIIWLVIKARRLKYRSSELSIIVPEYIPPKNASVAVSAAVLHSYHSKLAAQLTDLAVRHYIQILETRAKTTFRPAEYDVKVIRDIDDLRDEEKEVLSDIFGHMPAVDEQRSLKELQNNTAAYVRFSDNDRKLHDIMRSQYGIFHIDEEKRRWFGTFAKILLVAAILTFSIALFISWIVAFYLNKSLWVLSDDGLELRRYLKGLEVYIKAAEKERLKMLQSPEGAEKVDIHDPTNPAQLVKLYERVLPYAILFGQEKEWGKRLGDYYETTNSNPDWYSGKAAFNAVVFSSMISSFASSASATGASSSSSSSGGSGGGGFSGGGGGGGGGGGW